MSGEVLGTLYEQFHLTIERDWEHIESIVHQGGTLPHDNAEVVSYIDPEEGIMLAITKVPDVQSQEPLWPTLVIQIGSERAEYTMISADKARYTIHGTYVTQEASAYRLLEMRDGVKRLCELARKYPEQIIVSTGLPVYQTV